MPDDAVPWMIGGGVQHSVEVARLLAYAAFGGQEGVIGSRDLEVRETIPAGDSVRVFPGACSVLNRLPGKAYDAYACRFPFESTVDIAATGGDGPRTDLIVVRVENPFEDSAWPTPSNEEIATQTVIYRRIAVISGIGSQTPAAAIAALGYSALPLAKVTLPTSTATVQQQHITNCRVLGSVNSDSDEFMINPGTVTQLTSDVDVNWPGDVYANVDVPAWATHVTLRAILAGVKFGTVGQSSPGGNSPGWDSLGYLKVSLGGTVLTQNTNFNVSNEGGQDLTTIMTGGKVAVPLAMRGTTQVLRTRGRRTTGDAPLTSFSGTTVSLSARWGMAPESNL